jgi:uncharacterized protein with FMN-binding domain
MRRVILATAGTAAALALLLSLKTRAPAGLPQAPAAQNVPSHSPRPAAGKSHPAPAGSSGPGHPGSVTASVAGSVTQTIYGPVQVSITVKNGKIAAVRVPVFPDGTPHDQQVNSYALPQLVQETIAADSASISAVSGATYTSQGYISSLQNAIDKARA